jgi:hypothetical protein
MTVEEIKDEIRTLSRARKSKSADGSMMEWWMSSVQG